MKQRQIQTDKNMTPTKIYQKFSLNIERLDWIIENKTIWLLLLVFGVSILSKIFFIPSMGAIWFPLSDEHLQIELAKSFYYHNNFFSNLFFTSQNIQQFNEILFPFLLSPLYAFYTPENIITVFRIFGLIIMSCAVFPAYQLSLAILRNKKQALLISLFTILIPEMTLAFSVVQEVIYYPLFLFTLYVVYKRFSGTKDNPVFLGFLFFLLWTCKAVGATLFVGYVIYLCLEMSFIDKFRTFKTRVTYILIVIVTVLGLKELLSLGIRYLNYESFVSIRDFWTSTALTRLFNALNNFVSNFSNGIAHYLFFMALIFMIFPLILPIDNLDQYEKKDRKFLLFLIISFLVTVLTVVILIYMDEGGAAIKVQRVHYRYLFPYFIPFLIAMLKLDFSRLKIRFFGILYSSFIIIYFLLFQPRISLGSIIDAKSLLLIYSIQEKYFNGPSLVFLLVTIISVFLGFFIYRKHEGINAKKVLIWLIFIAAIVNQGYAIHYTYLYYTTFTHGITRKNEYSSLSRLVDTQPGIPIYVNLQSGIWLDVLYTSQSSKDLITARSSQNPLEFYYEPQKELNILITKNTYGISKIQNAKLIDTGLTLFNVYQFTNESDGIIKFDYLLKNTNPYSDSWVMDDSVLLIAGVDNKNQIEVTLSLNTNAQAKNIGAVLTDSTGGVSQVPVSPDGTTVKLTFNKYPDEQNFTISFGSSNYFIPAELGLNDDTRKLTYYLSSIEVN